VDACFPVAPFLNNTPWTDILARRAKPAHIHRRTLAQYRGVNCMSQRTVVNG